jgi:hypothetical protein
MLLPSDDTAILRARIARAFDALLNAALARLRLYYAARISGLMLVARSDRAAAVAALTNERDAALAELGRSIGESRRRAPIAARRMVRKRRYRIGLKSVDELRPYRPERGGRRTAVSIAAYPKP